MKRILIIAAMVSCLCCLATHRAQAQASLQVHPSQRYLAYASGEPFLYLGDTAWELFARLTVDEARQYLENRRLKGFTVIQAVVYTELDDTIPVLGVPRWVGNDATRISPRYLQHIDSIVSIAADMGLYIALLPTWGDKVDKQWGRGPVVFDETTARRYGEAIGRHFAAQPNIIWVLGGDRGGDGHAAAVWRAMAQGIRHSDPHHLMTFHPHGEHSSAMWFHNDEWLQFNMIQSGHWQDSFDIYRRLLLPDYHRTPVKPVMDAEPRYERIPRAFDAAARRFDDSDVRRSLYHSMLSGACGYTYGCNDIWQMYAPGYEPMCHADRYWYLSLDTPGACQLAHFVKLWNTFPFTQGAPQPGILLPDTDYTGDEAVAFGNDSYLLCYFPQGSRWILHLPASWQGAAYDLAWFSPVTGISLPAGSHSRSSFELLLPTAPTHQDWILTIQKK